jgi:O-antigen ligase
LPSFPDDEEVLNGQPSRSGGLRSRWVAIACSLWGGSAFFPLGVLYLNLLLMLVAFALAPDIRQRLQRLSRMGALVPVLAVCIWTLIAAGIGGIYPDTATRLFHAFRVTLVICMGLMLTPGEARLAIFGLMAAAVYAVSVVIAHHIVGLPDWAIWNSLLSSRNNFSSGNMITMAIAGGIAFLFATGTDVARGRRLGWLAFSVLIALVVVFHAVSRNSQLLLLVLVLAVVMFRFRSGKAVIAGVMASCLLAALAWQFSPTTHSRFAEMVANVQAVKTESDYVSSVGVRLRMYELAVRSMAAHPLVGTGVGSWLPLWRADARKLDAQQLPGEKPLSTINNPHNDFLLAGMETGVPGMLLLFWLVLYFVEAGWRWRTTEGGIAFVVGVAMLVTTIFNAPFRDAALGMTLLWMLGVALAYKEIQANA